MAKISTLTGIVLGSMSILSACGTTSRFVEEPRLIVDEPKRDARQAIGAVFGSLIPPYSVVLCEAEVATKQCKKGAPGIGAQGVGGLLLPLQLHVTRMEVHEQHAEPDGIAFEASLDARVDAISPLCGTVGGRVVGRPNETAFVELKSFYCNWVLVGNVIVNAKLSIDSISVRDRVVTGFYRLTFHGTGNAEGSGYYRAAIIPKS
jgi:hypothetical protein